MYLSSYFERLTSEVRVSTTRVFAAVPPVYSPPIFTPPLTLDLSIVGVMVLNCCFCAFFSSFFGWGAAGFAAGAAACCAFFCFSSCAACAGRSSEDCCTGVATVETGLFCTASKGFFCAASKGYFSGAGRCVPGFPKPCAARFILSYFFAKGFSWGAVVYFEYFGARSSLLPPIFC